MRIVICTVVLLAMTQVCHSESTYDQIMRLNREFEAADKELNDVYVKLMKRSDEKNKEFLKKAQRAWLVFRDADSQFQYDMFRDGTLASVVGSQRMVNLTKARAADLKGYMEWYR